MPNDHQTGADKVSRKGANDVHDVGVHSYGSGRGGRGETAPGSSENRGQAARPFSRRQGGDQVSNGPPGSRDPAVQPLLDDEDTGNRGHDNNRQHTTPCTAHPPQMHINSVLSGVGSAQSSIQPSDGNLPHADSNSLALDPGVYDPLGAAANPGNVLDSVQPASAQKKSLSMGLSPLHPD